MTLPTRGDWTEEFVHALTRFLIAGRPASAVHPVHNGVTCGPYDVRVALPQPHHDERIRIVVTYNRVAPPVEVTMPGTEIDAHLADEPEATAQRVTRWLLPRLAGQAA